MTESLATTVEQNSSSIEQMSRSVQARRARTAGGSPTWRDGAATSADADGALDRVGRDAGAAGRRGHARASRATREEGGADGAALDPGHRAAARGDGRSRPTVMREMGKRTSDITLDRRHHQPDRRAHQPAVAERLDRGGARRRRRPRLRGRRRGDPQPRRSLGQGDRRHRRRSSRRCRRWRRTRSTASNEGLRVADESNALAETGAAGLQQDPRPACPKRSTLVGADRARHRRAAHGAARPSSTRDRRDDRAGAGWSPRRPASRRPPRARSCRRPAQMRKIAQEVTKAVAEQGRASRDIIKAAQSTTEAGRAGAQGDRASRRSSAAEIAQAAESMRRGAATTSRAVARAGDRRRARSRKRRRGADAQVGDVSARR